MADAVVTMPARPSANDMTYTITIGNGERVTFKYVDILDPPQLTFATNIPRLDRVWDDERPNWDADDCAKISVLRGVTVALRYWPDVFKFKDDKRWLAAKTNWTEWKVCCLFHVFKA